MTVLYSFTSAYGYEFLISKKDGCPPELTIRKKNSKDNEMYIALESDDIENIINMLFKINQFTG